MYGTGVVAQVEVSGGARRLQQFQQTVQQGSCEIYTPEVKRMSGFHTIGRKQY